MMKDLKETVSLMTSTNYKERFKAEYWQLKIRYEKLKNMVENWDNLSFTPTCSKGTYEIQLESMSSYLFILKERAYLENVTLGDEEDE